MRQLPSGARLTAIFDSCHSATALDLPYIYDCYGNVKKQKVSRKNAAMNVLEAAYDVKSGNLLGALMSGQQALNSLTALGKYGLFSWNSCLDFSKMNMVGQKEKL